MSGATAIGLVSESLQRLLTAKLKDGNVEITLLSPDEAGGAKRVNLFLYKAQENALLKNQEWQVRPGDPGKLMPPPLALNLYYLLTAYATTDRQTGDRTAHGILGEAMRVLFECPIIPEEYLADGLKDTREQIKIMLAPIDMEELSRVWSTFGKPFRPTVMYEVSVVEFDMSAGRERLLRPRVSKVRVSEIDAPFVPPVLLAIKPLRLKAGETLAVSGEHLTGRKAVVWLMGKQILATGQLPDDTFEVTVPDELGLGLYELQVDIDTLCRRTFFFEVVKS